MRVVIYALGVGHLETSVFCTSMGPVYYLQHVAVVDLPSIDSFFSDAFPVQQTAALNAVSD